VSTHLAHLSRSQQTTLSLWSFAIVLTQRAGLTTVAAFGALLLGQAEPTVRERFRQWYRARMRARNRVQRQTARQYRRRDRRIQTCFAPLLRWVVAW
jgi:hypothetical protein